MRCSIPVMLCIVSLWSITGGGERLPGLGKIGIAQAAALSEESPGATGDALLQTGLRQYYRELPEALTTLQSALAEFQAGGDAAQVATTQIAIARVQASLNDPEAAIATAQQALQYYQQAGDPAGAAAALSALGWAYENAGDPDQAQKTTEAAIAQYAPLHDPMGEGLARLNLGAIQIDQNQYETGLAQVNQALTLLNTPTTDEMTALEASFDQGYAYYYLAKAQQGQQQYDAAHSALEQALAIGRQLDNPALQSAVLAQQGSLLAAQGDPDAALNSLKQAQAIADTLADSLLKAGIQVQIFMQQGQILAAKGDPDAALNSLKQVQAIADTLADSRLKTGLQSEILADYLTVTSSYMAQAQTHLTNGKVAESLAAAQQGIAVAQQVIDQAPALLELAQNQNWTDGIGGIQVLMAASHMELAQSYFLLGRGYSAQGQWQADLDAQQKAFNASTTGLAVAQKVLNSGLELPPQIRDAAQQLAQQGPVQIIQTHQFMALAYRSLGQYDQAIQQWQQALMLSQQINNSKLQLQTLLNPALDFQFLGQQQLQAQNYEQALATFKQGLTYSQQLLDLSQTQGDDTSHTQALKQQEEFYVYLGVTYADQNDYAAAITADKQALTIAQQLNDSDSEVLLLNSIATDYGQLSQYREALTFNQEALEIANTLNDPKTKLSVLYFLASTYGDLGRNQDALATYQQALSLYDTNANLQAEAVQTKAYILNNLSLIYEDLGDYNHALDHLNSALAAIRAFRARLEDPDNSEEMAKLCASGALDNIQNENQSTDSPDVIASNQQSYNQLIASTLQDCLNANWNSESKTLGNIAIVYLDQARYQEALDTYKKSLDIARNELHDRRIEATVLDNMGTIYGSSGHYAQALTFFQQGLDIRTDLKDQEGIAYSLNNIGENYSEQGQYDAAIQKLNQALSIANSLDLQSLKSTIFGNLANVYQSQGDYDQAEKLYCDSLALEQNRGSKPGEARVLHNLGGLSTVRGQYAQAIDYGQQALAMHQALGERSWESTDFNNLGFAYQGQGQFARALEAHQQALTIAQAIHNRSNQAAALAQLGNTYAALGQYEQGIKYNQQALDLMRTIGNRQGELDILGNLGFIYSKQKQYDLALQVFEQSLQIARDIGSVDGEARSLLYIGRLKEQTGDIAAAQTALQQALDIQQRIGAQGYAALSLLGLGMVYADQGDAQAMSYFQQALASDRELGDRPDEARVLAQMGRFLAKQGQPDLAIVFLKAAVNVREDLRSQLHSLTPELQQSFTNTFADDYRTLADLLLQQNRVIEAQRVLDLLKVQEIDDYLHDVRGTDNTETGIANRPAETAIYNESLAQVQQLIDLNDQIHQLETLNTLTPEQENHLIELGQQSQTQIQTFNDFLASPPIQAQVAKLRNTSNGSNLDLTQYRKLQKKLAALQQHAVLLYPLVLEDRLELILVTPDTAAPIRVTVPVKAVDLNRAIVDFRSALQNPFSDPLPPAQKLYDWLIRPLEPALTATHAQTIIYAPDGQLRYIPLQALNDGQQWLVQRFRVDNITAASLTDLTLLPHHDPRVFAGAFTQGSYQVTVGDRKTTLQGLPHAGQEVANVARLIPDTTERLNTDFTPDTTKLMNRYNIVHLATHAAFVPTNPNDSFILFGDGTPVSLADTSTWQLSNVDLVVLSACETGVGETLGDGREVSGLGYQMQTDGASATLASLWSVSDGGTEALMNAFYTALTHGYSKAEALQRAQEALIADDMSMVGRDRGNLARVTVETGDSVTLQGNLSHPYYWAPFILIGNGL